MNEHEYWNELGNLYFISGAYEPAIHAYARSIELDRSFGRPYSNMALAFVHIGRYPDAIELYHRSIELLTDAKEKAITWNRLGILYRQVKDYQSALVAYEQADKLDSRQDEMREEASRDVKYPLSISMPDIDLKAILARPEDEDFLKEVNDELQSAETELEIAWFDGDFVPPNPIDETVAEYLSEEDELLQNLTMSMEEEGWIPLVFDEAIAVGAPFEMVMQPANEQVQESASVTNTRMSQPEEVPQEVENETANRGFELIETNEEQVEVPENEMGSENQWTIVNEYQVNNGLLVHPDEVGAEDPANETLPNQWTEVGELPTVEISEDSSAHFAQTDDGNIENFENVSAGTTEYRTDGQADDPQAKVITEPAETEFPFQDQSLDLNNYDASIETNIHSTDANPQAVEYSQVEYPLVELSPAEINSIHIDIARFKRIIQINPRNAFAYDTLGGLYKALGKFKDAITSYQQAIAHDSTKPSYFYQLGLMYSAEKRDEEARDAFERVLSLNPGHILANASLGSYYRKMGFNDLAQKHIDIALQNVYEEESEYNQACLEAICGNTDRALELLQVAIEDNPSHINWAQHDPDLEALRHDQRFHIMIQAFAENK